MNMNEKGWNEFWDNEPNDEDEDEFNDVGSDIDANNDETFDNAAEWNEDEHEQLIARDNILSHTVRTGNAGWSPFGGKDLFTTPDSPTQSQSAGSMNAALHGSMSHQSLIVERQHQHQNHHQQRHQRNHHQQQQKQQSQQHPHQQQHHHQPHHHHNQQQQQQHPQQQQILMQQQQNILSLQHQLQQMVFLKQQQIEQEQRFMSQNPQCFTVEELEKQMFASMPNNSNNSQENPGVRQNRKQPTHDAPSKPARPNEKHDNYNNNNEKREGERQERFERDVRNTRENRDRRDNRDHREHRDNRDHRHSRDHRDHRDNRDRPRGRRGYTIIPPQVQLSVIDKAKRLHPITAMHSDEFLQDRMPTSEDGFSFKRHSTVSGEKVIHDGVLTEKERCWLTKIQEKIQADYDDNMDQDYYYLLYFNRSPMTDEAAQKPCGPGVLDRRFIPRERLLYNSST